MSAEERAAHGARGPARLGLLGLGRNIAGTFARQVVAALLQLGILSLIARAYGPEINGGYAVALLLPTMLATILNLGIAPANVYYLGAGLYTAREVLRTSLRISLALTSLGLPLGTAIVLFKGDALFPGVQSQVLILALAILPISLGNAFVLSIFQGLQQFGRLNLVGLLRPLLLMLAVAGLVLGGVQGLSWLVMATIGAGLATLVLAFGLMRSQLEARPGAARYRSKTALSYGYKAHLSNILAFINYRADIFLVNFFSGPAAAGVYVIAVQLAEGLWLLSQAVSTVALPRLSQLSSDEDARRQLTPLLVRLTLLATAAGAAALMAVAYPLVLTLFGEAFSASVLPLFVLLPGIIAGAASRIIANDIAARGRPELNMYLAVATVSVNVGGNILLIPLYGLMGAALATTLAYSLNLCLRLLVYRRLSAVSPKTALVPRRADITMIIGLLRTAA